MSLEELKRHPGLLLELNKWRQDFLAETEKYLTQSPIPERRLDRETRPLQIADKFREQIDALRRQYGATGMRTFISVILSRNYLGPGLRDVHCAVVCHTYEEVKQKSEDRGYYALSRLAYREAHRYLCMSYLRSRDKRLIMRWPSYFLWGSMSGYGQSPSRWLTFVFGLIVAFALYFTPTPQFLEPLFGPLNSVRPAIAYRTEVKSRSGPDLAECLEYSASMFVGSDSDRIEGRNRTARLASSLETGIGLTMFVVLGHLLSMRITGRIESVA